MFKVLYSNMSLHSSHSFVYIQYHVFMSFRLKKIQSKKKERKQREEKERVERLGDAAATDGPVANLIMDDVDEDLLFND